MVDQVRRIEKEIKKKGFDSVNECLKMQDAVDESLMLNFLNHQQRVATINDYGEKLAKNIVFLLQKRVSPQCNRSRIYQELFGEKASIYHEVVSSSITTVGDYLVDYSSDELRLLQEKPLYFLHPKPHKIDPEYNNEVRHLEKKLKGLFNEAYSFFEAMHCLIGHFHNIDFSSNMSNKKAFIAKEVSKKHSDLGELIDLTISLKTKRDRSDYHKRAYLYEFSNIRNSYIHHLSPFTNFRGDFLSSKNYSNQPSIVCSYQDTNNQKGTYVPYDVGFRIFHNMINSYNYLSASLFNQKLSKPFEGKLPSFNPIK